MTLPAILAAALALCTWAPDPPLPAPAGNTTIKLATLFPTGSVWDKAFRTMGSDWKKETDGRIKLLIYPSGSVGDEPDILRKMRIGQINAASLSISGLGYIDPAFKAFQIPMYFESQAEAMYVVRQLTPVLEQRLEEKGFVFLQWAPAGWIYLFSAQPVRSPDDLRQLKQFLWSGEADAIAWWEENGFKPVPLAATDIPMGLSTGLIEAVPSPPVTALAYQWFRSTPYMLDLGAMPFLGATVITKKAWDRISAADQALMRAAGKRAEQSIVRQVPVQERQAIIEMQKRGMTVVPPADDGAEWKILAGRFSDTMKATAIPAEIFTQVERLRSEYRAMSVKADGKGEGPEDSG